MRASLRLTDPSGSVRIFPLVEGELVIGRDPSCAIAIESAHVSWHHAAIRLEQGRHIVVDLGSTNGTTINGNVVTIAAPLHAGDRIVLGGEIQIEHCVEIDEADPRARVIRMGMGLAVAALLLLVIVLVSRLPWGESTDPEFMKAVDLAHRGIDAARGGNELEARDLLREAAGQLYTAGYLDDVAIGDLQRVAMELLQDDLDVPFDLWAFYDHVLRQVRIPESTGPRTRERCRLDDVETSLIEPCLQQWIEHVLSEIRQDTDSIPADFHRAVGDRLRAENQFLRRSLKRGESLIPMLRQELEAARMPPLLHYLALIESGYLNSATSTAAAAGVWQFMPATARQYGLRVDDEVDERREPEKATRAAARYLRDLAFEFGGDALLLALAGYNRGENAVRRSLKKLDDPFSDRSYWRLVERDLLPDETQSYVPRFIAAAVAGEGGLPSEEALREAGY